MTLISSSASRLVYTTEGGRACPRCRRPVAACTCSQAAPPHAAGPVRVLLQSKGRGGKSVTLVQGLPLVGEALNALARQLRTACGSGGTVKAGVVEVQGDHCERVLAELQRVGYRAKRAGG
ncbi:MAG: translation initiation factor Sui1 [Polaromonas sp.]|nr:translation initiation factor Sui1 [Polaromonas sp.]